MKMSRGAHYCPVQLANIPPPFIVDSIVSAHGTAIFYEDSASVSEWAGKFPAYKDVFPDWSLQSSGMHQFTLWTALDAAGLGANLQHYQIVESVVTRAAEMYKVPKSWSMQAQLVFGALAEGGRPTEVSTNSERGRRERKGVMGQC